MANATSEKLVGGKKLTELKVVELLSELEKRGFDNTGVKAVLLERLEKTLESEGKIPGDYLFAESELKSKISSGHLSQGAMENGMKDDEEDGEEAGLVTSEECTDENGSTNVNSNLEIENSDKVMDIAPTVDNVDKVKSDVQNIIPNEEQQPSPEKQQPSPEKQQPSPEKQITLDKDLDLNNTTPQVETNDNSTDPLARPPQSTSTAAAEANIKEEDVQNDDSTRDHSTPAILIEVKEDRGQKDSQNAVFDILPPTPSVPCVAPLTLEDTINMDTSNVPQKGDNESLVLHEDAQNNLDTLQMNGLKLRQAAKMKAVGKREAKKSDIGSRFLEDGGESNGEVEGTQVMEVDGGGDKGNMEVKTEKKADEKKDDKDGKLKSYSCPSVSKHKDIKNLKADGQNSRNLWVSNLSPNTKVADMKGLFSKYGKVLTSKVVVTNARGPEAKCYVFITMSTAKEASKCIEHLNQTELHGKTIAVERSKNDSGTQTAKKAEGKPNEKKSEKLELKKESSSPNSPNLWISSLSSNTRATDLKELFSKYGKVVGAKVVTSGRRPGAQCYGFLTMSSAEEASKCIQHLNQTELHGSMISVERAKNEPGTVKKTENKSGEKKSEVKKDDKSRVVVMDNSKGEPVISVKRGNKESRDKLKPSSSKEKVSTTSPVKSKDKETTSEGVKDKSKESKKDILSFDQIKMSQSSKAGKLSKYFKDKREKELVRKREKRRRKNKRRQIRKFYQAQLIETDIQRRQKEETVQLKKLGMKKKNIKRKKVEIEKIRLGHKYFEHEKIHDERLQAEPYKFNEFEHRDYERVEHYDRDARSIDTTSATRFEERKDRDLSRRDIGPVREIHDRDDRHPDEHNHPSDHFDRFNEFEQRDYERRMEHYDRRDARSIHTTSATRFEERKDRDLSRRDIGPVREIHDRDDRRPDERNHPSDRFDRTTREQLEQMKLEREKLKLEREALERERLRNEHLQAEMRRFEEQMQVINKSFERGNVQKEGFWNEAKRPRSNATSTRFEPSFSSNESRFEEQRRAMKRSYERSNVQEEGFWNETKRPHLNTPSTRYEPSFSSIESRFNEFEHRDYERVEHYDRDARSIDTTSATRFEERKDRDLSRRDIGPVREIHDRDDRHPDEHNHPSDHFDRRDIGPNRDQIHNSHYRDLGPDRRNSEQRNISARDRLDQVRNLPAVTPPDQRTLWGSGIDQKVDTWFHPHSNLDNSGNHPNDGWMNNNIAPNYNRGAGSGDFVSGSGDFVSGSGDFGSGSGDFGSGSGGMVQNMEHGNMFVHAQTQPSNMMVRKEPVI